MVFAFEGILTGGMVMVDRVLVAGKAVYELPGCGAKQQQHIHGSDKNDMEPFAEQAAKIGIIPKL